MDVPLTILNHISCGNSYSRVFKYANSITVLKCLKQPPHGLSVVVKDPLHFLRFFCDLAVWPLRLCKDEKHIQSK